MAELGSNISGSPFTNGNGNDRADGNTRIAPVNGITTSLSWRVAIPAPGPPITANAYGAIFERNGTSWTKLGQVSFGTINLIAALYTQPLVVNLVANRVYHILGWCDQNYDDYLDFTQYAGDTMSIFLGAIGGTFPTSYLESNVMYAGGKDTQMAIYATYTVIPNPSITGIQAITGAQALTL